jgi:hypothetical protein
VGDKLCMALVVDAVPAQRAFHPIRKGQ